MRAAAIVLALAGIALVFWWLRDDPTPRAERADHGARPDPASERREVPPPEDTGKALERGPGSVPADDGKRRPEHTAEETLDLVVHVTCEGLARLPDGLRVTYPQLVDPVFDADRAEVRGRFVRPPDPRSMFVTVTAPGYSHAEVLAALPRPGTLMSVEANLDPTRRVVCTGTREAWTAQVLVLERRHQEARRKVGNTWVESEGIFWMPARPEGRRINRFTGEVRWDLRAGRYRIVLKDTPFVLSEFEVARDDIELRIDLPRVAWQEITLRAPAEVPMDDARLVVNNRSITPDGFDAGAAYFSILLPGDREVVLEPRHPFTHPGEPLRLVAAGDDLVVDLRPRPLVRFELPAGEKGVPEFLLDREGHQVGGGNALPFGSGYALVAEPGSYRLRIRVANKPRFDREIDVPAGGLDLGLVTLR